MKKFICIALILVMVLTACGNDKKDSNKSDDGITAFELCSRSFNEGENTLRLRFYTNDKSAWKKVKSATLKIGSAVIKSTKASADVDNELIDSRYYVGQFEFSGSFAKAKGKAEITVNFGKGKEQTYDVGYFNVYGAPTAENGYFSIINADAITLTKEGYTSNYGLIVRIIVHKDVEVWGLNMGLDHVYADTSLVYEIGSENYVNALNMAANGTFNMLYEDCYERRPGNDACMASFRLKTGEHVLYIPFQYEDGYYDVRSSSFKATFSAENLPPSEYISGEFIYSNN